MSIKDCPRVPITDVLSFIVDNRGKTVPTAETGTPLIATNCILNERLYPVFENIRYVSDDVLQNWFRAHLKPHDILFVNKGTPGRCCLVPDPVTFCAAQDMIGLRCDAQKIYYRYLLMVLRSAEIQKTISNNHVGLVIPHFKKENLPQLMIPVPEMEEQKALGDLYFQLCEKIENNNAICSNLEAMAKLLYDYWFVQFDFPDENGKPYKSSGGKMVWNDDLKREIPVGWEAGVLGDVIEKYTDGISSSNIGDLPYTPMDILPMRQMSFSETGSQEDANSSLIRYKKYSLLFGAMRPYFHRVCIAPFDGITRTTVFTLKERGNGELGYAFETLDQDYTVNYANAHHVGTQQPYAEWDGNLEKCPIPLPPAELRRKYSQMISDYIDVVIERNLENKQLASLRDFLLPMLMNGQVKVC